MGIAVETGQRQVFWNGFAPVLLRYNVIDLKWNAVQGLRNLTVLAPVTGPPPRFFLNESPHKEAGSPLRCNERRALD